MKGRDVTERSRAEQIGRRIGRAAFGLVVAGLVAGVSLYFLGQRPASSFVVASTVALLLVLPVVNVVAVLAEEVRRRDWGFTWLALAVLAMLAYAIASRVFAAPVG